MKTGRNDPCPCGSGEKYKHCCDGKESGRSQDAGVFNDLRQLMEGRDFGSLREAQAFVSWHMGQKNWAPLDDFEGLSPEQMGRFLHYPFSSPDLATFPERLATPPEAPLVRLFGLLAARASKPRRRATCPPRHTHRDRVFRPPCDKARERACRIDQKIPGPVRPDRRVPEAYGRGRYGRSPSTSVPGLRRKV